MICLLYYVTLIQDICRSISIFHWILSDECNATRDTRFYQCIAGLVTNQSMSQLPAADRSTIHPLALFYAIDSKSYVWKAQTKFVYRAHVSVFSLVRVHVVR